MKDQFKEIDAPFLHQMFLLVGVFVNGERERWLLQKKTEKLGGPFTRAGSLVLPTAVAHQNRLMVGMHTSLFSSAKNIHFFYQNYIA